MRLFWVIVLLIVALCVGCDEETGGVVTSDSTYRSDDAAEEGPAVIPLPPTIALVAIGTGTLGLLRWAGWQTDKRRRRQ